MWRRREEGRGANCKTDRKVAKIATTLKAALNEVPTFWDYNLTLIKFKWYFCISVHNSRPITYCSETKRFQVPVID